MNAKLATVAIQIVLHAICRKLVLLVRPIVLCVIRAIVAIQIVLHAICRKLVLLVRPIVLCVIRAM